VELVEVTVVPGKEGPKTMTRLLFKWSSYTAWLRCCLVRLQVHRNEKLDEARESVEFKIDHCTA